MKLWLAASILVGVVTIFGTSPRTAQPSNPYDLYQFVCLPKLDLVELRLIGFFGEIRQGSIGIRNEHLEQAYGIFGPHWLADPDPDPKADGMDPASQPVRFTCALASGPVEIEVKAVPDGRYSLAIAVTVSTSDRKLVEELCLSCCAFCDNENAIKRLSYDDRSGSLTLYGEFLREPRNLSVAGPIYDPYRRFFIETDGIRAADPEATGWTRRQSALTAHDIPVADWRTGE